MQAERVRSRAGRAGEVHFFSIGEFFFFFDARPRERKKQKSSFLTKLDSFLFFRSLCRVSFLRSLS